MKLITLATGAPEISTSVCFMVKLLIDSQIPSFDTRRGVAVEVVATIVVECDSLDTL